MRILTLVIHLHDRDESAVDHKAILDLIMETCPDAVVIMGVDGVIQCAGASAEVVFGRPPEELVGMRFDALFSGPKPPDGKAALEGGRPARRRRAALGLGRDGETFPAEVTLGAAEDGATRLMVGFVRDISQRVEALNCVAELKRKLDRLGRMMAIGELATALSHELNQPLTAIAAYCAALRRAAEAPDSTAPQVSETIGDLEAEAVRAGEIIRRMQRLVDYGDFRRASEDLAEVIREAWVLATRFFPPDSASLDVDLAPDLPRVLIDRIPIQQVLVNVLTNAIDSFEPEGSGGGAAREGQDRRTIKISASVQPEGAVCVAIRDGGLGIPPEQIESVFQPFNKNRQGGLGVGLAICRSIVSAHGGRIWAENNPDGGVTVRFTVPVAGQG